MRRSLRLLPILLSLTASVTALSATSTDFQRPLNTHMIPEKTLGEIRETASEFLTRHAKQNMGKLLFKQTYAKGEVWTEVSDLGITRIMVRPVDSEAKARGVVGRYLVFLDCTQSRAYRTGHTGWTEWSRGLGNFLPPAVIVERKSDGLWHPSLKLSMPLFAFYREGDPDMISVKSPKLVRPRIQPPMSQLASGPAIPEEDSQATLPSSLKVVRFPAPLAAALETTQVVEESPFAETIPLLSASLVIAGFVACFPRKSLKRTRKSGRRRSTSLAASSIDPLSRSRVCEILSVRPGVV